MTDTEHPNIRWNPDLQEWFCPKCGLTSDHTAEQDAAAEIAGFDCSLHGMTVAKLGEKERLLRAHYLTKKRKQNE
jgi:hypothetical protein